MAKRHLRRGAEPASGEAQGQPRSGDCSNSAAGFSVRDADRPAPWSLGSCGFRDRGDAEFAGEEGGHEGGLEDPQPVYNHLVLLNGVIHR